MIRPAGKFLLSLLGAAAAALAIVFSVLAWLLSAGPIPLGFLSPYLRNALETMESEFRVEFDNVVLTWGGWDRNLDVRLVGVRVFRAGGQSLASVPEMSVGLSGRALLRGRFAFTSLDMIGAQVRLVRRADGRIDFGLEQVDNEMVGLGEELVQALLNAPDSTRMLGTLRRVSVLGASITLDDQVAETLWRAADADVVLVRDAAGIKGDAQADVKLGEVTTRLVVQAAYRSAGQKIRFDVTFGGVEPARLAAVDRRFARLAPAEMPVSGSIGFTLDLDGTASGLEFEIEAGPGRLNLPDRFDEPIPIARASLRGRMADTFDAVTVEAMRADLDGPQISLQGRLAFPGNAFGIEASGRIDDLPVAALKRFWPRGVALSSRRWIESHLHDGTIRNLEYRLNLPADRPAGAPLAADAAALTFDFDGVVAVYYSALPPISGARGSVRMNAETLDLALSGAQVQGLEVGEGSLRISGLGHKGTMADISVVVTGRVDRMMALLDREPLAFARAVGLDPRVLGGTSASRMQFRMPLKRGLLLREIQFSAAANLSEVAIPGLFGNYALSGGILSLRVDGGGMSVAGNAALNGVPIKLAWERKFGKVQGPRTRYALSGTLDDAARSALLLPLGANVKGVVTADMEIFDGGEDGRRFSATLGLDGAEVVIPPLRWSKPAGVAGSLRLTARAAGDGGIAFSSLELAAADLVAVARADFGPAWAFRRLELSRLVFGGPDGTDVAATVDALADGGMSVVVEGTRLDLRPYLEGDKDPLQGALPALTVAARVDQASLYDGIRLQQANGAASFDGERWQKLRVAGRLNGAAPIEIALSSKGEARELVVTSPDAGSVARALGLISSIEGGTLNATAMIPDPGSDGPVSGRITVDTFRLVKAPVLANILTLGSLTGVADLLNGKGINFVRFVAPFDLADDRLRLKRARAYGPALGITLEGVVDRSSGSADLKGTLVPAYTINSLIGKIPLLGNILVGKEGEGVFALTYAIKGPIDNPRVFVNPLSALTPGILRRIFEGGAGFKAVPETGEERGPG